MRLMHAEIRLVCVNVLVLLLHICSYSVVVKSHDRKLSPVIYGNDTLSVGVLDHKRGRGWNQTPSYTYCLLLTGSGA